MRVLMLHNRYLFSGGEDRSTEAEADLLSRNGHEVELLEQDNTRIQELGKARVALRTIWAQESFRQIEKKLGSARFDVLHVQNFFPLWSPSVYYAASRQGVPVVQTLRNYRLICSNSYFFRDNAVCEDCLGRFVPWPGIMHGCYRESRLASSTVAAMIGFHKLAGAWRERVGVYIALTDFARDKYVLGGLPAEKIVVKPNFVDPSPAPGTGAGGYALYVGRLSPEKGIATMLQAWNNAEQALPLKIVGDGPLAPQVNAAACATPVIEYLGPQKSDAVMELMRHAGVLIFPSECYETMGRTIIEAFAVGTPVLTSALGERASIVVPGHTGFHFPPGDVAALRQQIEWCSRNLDELRAMRVAARATFEERYTGAKNAELLIDIYRQAQHRSS